MWQHGFFILCACLNLIALVAQYFYTANPLHYFSFFTILANIALVVLFLSIGLIKTPSTQLQTIFGVVVSYVVMAGVVYWLWLQDDPQLITVWWVTHILHTGMPLAGIISWQLLPFHKKLSVTFILHWLIFPTFYLIYLFILKYITGWFPYSF